MNSIDRLRQNLTDTAGKLQQLKTEVLTNGFATQAEEIHFFKHTKPTSQPAKSTKPTTLPSKPIARKVPLKCAALTAGSTGMAFKPRRRYNTYCWNE